MATAAGRIVVAIAAGHMVVATAAGRIVVATAPGCIVVVTAAGHLYCLQFNVSRDEAQLKMCIHKCRSFFHVLNHFFFTLFACTVQLYFTHLTYLVA